jgi:hypothetical protein
MEINKKFSHSAMATLTQCVFLVVSSCREKERVLATENFISSHSLLFVIDGDDDDDSVYGLFAFYLFLLVSILKKIV